PGREAESPKRQRRGDPCPLPELALPRLRRRPLTTSRRRAGGRSQCQTMSRARKVRRRPAQQRFVAPLAGRQVWSAQERFVTLAATKVRPRRCPRSGVAESSLGLAALGLLLATTRRPLGGPSGGPLFGALCRVLGE